MKHKGQYLQRVPQLATATALVALLLMAAVTTLGIGPRPAEATTTTITSSQTVGNYNILAYQLLKVSYVVTSKFSIMSDHF